MKLRARLTIDGESHSYLEDTLSHARTALSEGVYQDERYRNEAVERIDRSLQLLEWRPENVSDDLAAWLDGCAHAIGEYCPTAEPVALLQAAQACLQAARTQELIPAGAADVPVLDPRQAARLYGPRESYTIPVAPVIGGSILQPMQAVGIDPVTDIVHFVHNPFVTYLMEKADEDLDSLKARLFREPGFTPNHLSQLAQLSGCTVERYASPALSPYADSNQAAVAVSVAERVRRMVGQLKTED